MTKASELREMSDEHIELLMKDTKEHFFRLRLQAQTERLDAPSELRKQRRLIARINTIRNQRRAGGGRQSKQCPSSPPRPVEARGKQTMPGRVAVGIVTSDKTAKTRRVEIPRLVKDPAVRQIPPPQDLCTVHDEQNESHAGDKVEIVECRPMSRTKRWKLVRVVEKGRAGRPGRACAPRPARIASEGDEPVGILD